MSFLKILQWLYIGEKKNCKRRLYILYANRYSMYQFVRFEKNYKNFWQKLKDIMCRLRVYIININWLMIPLLFTYKTVVFKMMLKSSFLSTFEEDKVTFSLEASKNMLDMHIFALFISSVGWDLDVFQRAER